MSKKVDVRLPAVAARAQAHRLDRNANVKDLTVAPLYSAIRAQTASAHASGFAARPSIVENQVQVPKENRQHPTKAASPPKESRDSRGASAAPLLSFTAGDLCAQLDVLSRPIYLCDSFVSAPKSKSKVQREPSLWTATRHMAAGDTCASQAAWQASRALASSALERLGSASSNSFSSAPAAGGAMRLSSHNGGASGTGVNKLFAEGSTPPDGCDPIGLSSASDGERLSCRSTAVAFDKELPLTELTDTPAAIFDFDSEVLDVWIDESDGTTGSSNSTGLAARDLLHLSSLAHDCSKGSETLHPCFYCVESAPSVMRIRQLSLMLSSAGTDTAELPCRLLLAFINAMFLSADDVNNTLAGTTLFDILLMFNCSRADAVRRRPGRPAQLEAAAAHPGGEVQQVEVTMRKVAAGETAASCISQLCAFLCNCSRAQHLGTFLSTETILFSTEIGFFATYIPRS